MSPIRKFSLFLILFLVLPLAAGRLCAQQQPYVSVRLAPAHADWNWAPYARELTSAFEQALTSRVREGLPRREFELVRDTLELKFFFRLDLDGNIRRFAPLSPDHRYLSYLVQRTARELPPPGPLPDDYPTFKFDGELTFKLGFVPTGRYKRLYFEEPLDSLELPGFEPLIITRGSDDLLLYEPPDLDKNKLLEEYRRRLGLHGEMTDTSSFTPLDFRGMYLAVRLPYDSLYFGMQDTSALRDSLHAALEREGARVLNDLSSDYEVPMEAVAPPEDSLSLNDTTLAGKALETPEVAVRDTLLPARDLPEAFRKVVDPKRAFVLSAALTPDSIPGRALCRLQFFLAEQPGKIKRSIAYRFSLRDSLPDTLGRALVNRLARPPQRPKPPEPPKPAAPPPAAPDTTKPAPSDSAAAGSQDTSSTAPATVQPPAAPVDSAAPTDTLQAPDRTAPPNPPDTLQQAPDSTAPANEPTPPEPGSDTPQQTDPMVPPEDGSQSEPQTPPDSTGAAPPNP